MSKNDSSDLEMGRVDALEAVRSAASISMSPELFEKLYLSPPNAVKGDLRKTFGNPTPMSVHISQKPQNKRADSNQQGPRRIPTSSDATILRFDGLARGWEFRCSINSRLLF
ncbi:hypothetical protein NW762_003126 [Fusarium torreyae]|uniref:Uncharacterized protein n=1 Tax=Fusarium torreyae TaxID=1237075 RepID=A0A9W8S8T1_9HYPO|nr:hypothetical protein NW762_003126 [Fusarium torreyae]